MKKLLLVLMFLSRLSFADCGLSISASSVPISWNQNFNFQAVTITVVKSHEKACDVGVTFSAGGAANYATRRMINGASSLGYQLYQDAALTHVLKDYPDLSSASDFDLLSFPAGKNLSQVLTYYIRIVATAQLSASGTYTDSFNIKAYEGSNFATYLSPQAVAAVSVSTMIPKQIALSLVGMGQAFNPTSTSHSLNFGTLTSGAVLGFDLLVQSNAGFAISFSSQNSGTLKNASPQISTVVGYGMQVDGSVKNLSASGAAPVVVAIGSGQTDITGNRHNIAVTIGSVDESMAGTYTDNITVTATTTE